VGVVKVLKSGKVRMKIGCCEFVVRPGVEHKCRSEVHVLNLATNDIVIVGHSSKHAVAALDMDAFLRHMDSSKGAV
jgi:hypothetical protein